jgi:2-dehydropantoate 2-reductase
MQKKIAVLGAGAIGASIGAYLTRDGYDVTLIDQWAAHIEKIKADGLKLTDVSGEYIVPVKALHLSDVSGLKEQFDVVYLSVKSYDTRWSTYFIEPFLKSSGFILPAQNSLNDETVARIVGFERTVGCVPSIGAAVYEPGHVIRTDSMAIHSFTVGELTGLITPRVLETVESLKSFGHCEATKNIWGARWSKLVVNCMTNTLSGLIGPALSSLDEEQRDVTNSIRAMAGSEAARVGLTLGIVVEPVWGIPAREFADVRTKKEAAAIKAKMEAALAKIYPDPEQAKKIGAPGRPSLLQDVMKGRRTEVDYLNGFVVRKAEEAGVPVPMNQEIVRLMKQLEAGEINSDPSHLEKLSSYLTF